MEKKHCSDELFQELLKQTWPKEYLETLDEALAYIKEKWTNLPMSRERPIFILSAGWRTGSTLLQRLLNSDPRLCIFGEVFEHLFLWHKMASQLNRYSKFDQDHSFYLPEAFADIPTEVVYYSLTQDFIANLSPPFTSFKKAHHSFVETLLKDPAASLGKNRWGLKLVRSDAAVAKYFHWLYPEGRIIFLYRNPYDAYQSYKAASAADKRFYYLYQPTHPIATARDFIIHWRHCLSGFLGSTSELNALVLKYEDIKAGKSLDILEDYLDVHISDKILKVHVGVSEDKKELSSEDRETIRFYAGEYLDICGY